MRSLTVRLMLAASLAAAVVADQTPTPSRATGAISGVVLDGRTQTPLDGAIVFLSRGFGAPATTPPRQLTDAAGRFVFTELPAGTDYRLTATRDGFLPSTHGRDLNAGAAPARSLDLMDGQWIANARITMWPANAVSGTVTDEAGEPVVNAFVRVLSLFTVAGRDQVAAGPVTTTDDRGTYRIAGLPPGRYVVQVPSVQTAAPPDASDAALAGLSRDAEAALRASGRPTRTMPALDADPRGRLVLGPYHPPPPPQQGRLLAYPIAFHPAAPTLDQATIIRLDFGSERPGTDVRITPVPTARVSGVVQGPPEAQREALRLMPAGLEHLGIGSETAIAVPDDQGRFTFLNVPNGTYEIVAGRFTAQYTTSLFAPGGDGPSLPSGLSQPMSWNSIGVEAAPPGTSYQVQTGNTSGGDYTGQLAVSVTGQDVSGLVVTLHSTSTLTGRVELDRDPNQPDVPAPSLSGLQLEPADGTPRLGRPQSSGLNREGRAPDELIIENVRPGRYFLRGGPQNWTIKSVIADGKEHLDQPLDFTSGPLSGVVVTLTNKRAMLRGTVIGDADLDAAVIAFPADRTRWTSYGLTPPRFESLTAAPDGWFEIRTLPAGDYLVVAVPRDRIDAWQSPAFLEQAAAVASRTTLHWGEAASVQLRVQQIRGPATELARHPAVVGADPPLPLAEGDSAAASGAGSPAAARQEPNPASASVLGTVVGADGGPIRRAIVTVKGDGQNRQRSAITDDTGGFRIEGLSAGSVEITTQKAAYLPSMAGARGPGRPGTPVTLKAGQPAQVRITMWRGSVLAGSLRDATGRPAADVPIMVVEARTRAMHRGGSARAVATDDRGGYRIFGLLPGKYFVVALPQSGGRGEIAALRQAEVDARLGRLRQRSGAATPIPSANTPGPAPALQPSVNYAPMYFPGTALFTQASAVTVADEEERSGLDFVVSPVPALTIDGIVLDESGQPPASVQLSIYGQGPRFGGLTGASPVLSRAPGPDGRFTYSNVPPDMYTIIARAGASPAPVPARGTGAGGGATFSPLSGGAAPGQYRYAVVDADVGSMDVTGLTLRLQPGATVAGRTHFDGTTPRPASLAGVRVALANPAGNWSSSGFGTTMGPSLGAATPAVVREDGTFTVANIAPGTYEVQVVTPAALKGWWLQSATIGGRDILDQPLRVTGPEPLEAVVRFSDRRTAITGTLQDASGRPVTEYYVIAFATDSAVWRPGGRRVRAVRPGQSGQFLIDGLPPGEYFVAAVTDIAPGEWDDPAFLTELSRASARLILAEGETKVQSYRVR